MRRLLNIPWRSLPSWLNGNRLHILMYHSISDNPNDPNAISPTEFKRQMRLLQSAHVISLKEGLGLLRDKRLLKNTCVITFDDALLDFYTTAMPILKEFGYPSTMFVPTGLVGTNSVWDSYDKTKPLMNWEQIQECPKWGVSFGSHTVNHVRLTKCDDANLMSELNTSLQTLRDRLGNVIPALAYPGGYYDDRVRDAVRRAGYVCALIAASRWGNGSESDPFQLRRQRLTV